MTNTSTNVASDAEEIELYPEPQLSRTSNGNVNNWSDVSIDGEIKRGNTLRENKPAPIRPKDTRPKIVSFKNPHSDRKLRKRYTIKSSNNTSLCGCSHWPIPSYPKSDLPSSTYPQNITRLQSKSNNQPRCSMRTAALAVPSKRHCLETWRTKSYILPDFMIDRLKQHVMDQRPLVQITDAINCFRKKKPRLHKKSSNKSNGIVSIQMPLKCPGTQTLSLLFAKKIVQKLITPLNITLNSDLEKIYRVVSVDISQIAKYKQFNIQEQELQKYRTIHCDVSKKVTIWIAGILEDLKDKLLEEDLLELEEKEGPVLDFLDDVVNKVLDICVPIPSSVGESDYFDSFSTAESIENEEEPPQYFENEFTDSDHFKQEINQIIDKFEEEPESPALTNNEYFQTEIQNIIDLLFKEHKIQLSDTEYFQNEIYDILSIVWKESGDNIGEANETDVSEILSDGADDRSKKVMFSVSDMAEHNANTGSIRKINEVLGLNNDGENQEHDQIKRNIYFAEPNTHLLSNADELWPQDIISPHVLRPSASVTKSIISLGNLWEKDEKYMTPSQTDASVTDLENLEPGGKLQDIELLKSITSLAKLLQDGEKKVLNKTDIAGTLNILQDIDIIKSITSLAKAFKDDEKKAFTEASADTARKLNQLYIGSHAEISKSIISLVQILQKDENEWIPEEANAIIPLILNQLIEELPGLDVTKSIATLVNVLRSNQVEPPAAASNVNIIDKLALLNEELIQNQEMTKSIMSLVRLMETDENHIKTEKLNLQDDEIQEVEIHKVKSLLAGDLADKCDAHSQTDQVKTLEVVVLEATRIGSVDSNLCEDADKNDLVQEKLQAEVADDVKNKIKTKTTGSVTEPMKNYSDLDDEWKVHLRTAPSWIAQTNAHGEPSEDSVPVQGKTKRLTQSDIRKWCKDLDKGYKNLDIWKDWLRNTCKEATSLLKKKNACSCWNHKQTKNWIKLRNNVAKDAALWRQMNQHTHDTFECFQKYYGNMEIIIPAKTKPRCACKDKYYITQNRNM